MDETDRAEQLRQKRLSRRKQRELAQADLADAGPNRLLAMAEAAGISSDQIAAVAQSVVGGPSTENQAAPPPPAKKTKSGGSSGGGGLGGMLDGILGGANPMAMAEVASTSIAALVTALGIVLGIFLIGTVFVIPRGYRIFWLLLVGLTALFVGGFRLYQEWVNAASEQDEESYRSMAQGLLTGLTVVYTIVFVSILFVMIWKIAVMAKRKSDVLDGRAPAQKHVMVDEVNASFNTTPRKTTKQKNKGTDHVDLESRDVYM